MTQKHTPTPWETNYTGNIWGDVNNPKHDGDSPLLFTPHGEQEANAAHIVKCVNGWDEQQAKIDELVEASVSALAAINAALVTLYDAYGKDGGELTGRINAIDTIQGFKLEIEAALAKAKGE